MGKSVYILFNRNVNGGSNDEPLTRLGDEAFGDLNRVIVAQTKKSGLRGISWGSLFTFFSTEFRADRWVNGGSNDEPLTRLGDEAFGDLNRVIVAQIEENDKVRSVYGGSVLRIERNGQVRRAGRSSRAYSTHGV